MANYNVDIAVALKGADQLARFSKQIKDFAANIKGANIFIESFSKGSEGIVRNKVIYKKILMKHQIILEMLL